MIMMMDDVIVLEDGVTVRVEGRPAQGTRHHLVLGSLPTGEQVVVKLEQVAGALVRERRALTWLEGRRVPTPRLLAAGVAVVGSERIPCLVIERRQGAAPTTTDGWRRMGRALAFLAELAGPGGGLPVLDHARFGARHAERVDELGHRLDPLVKAAPDWPQLTSPVAVASAPLVLTHGDPGPGNFLDDGGDGSLVDWEEAHFAPRGLDVARLVFMAFLGSGPSGYVARDHRVRADAAARSYLGSLRHPWQPTVEESRWWITVAGIQFVYRRWRRGGPAPWEQAVDVLLDVLAKGAPWPAP